MEKIEKLSKEQLDEKQHLILGLSEDLLEALKNSKVFKNGLSNKQIILDILMGIGYFTASILDAADRTAHVKGVLTDFYKEQLLPSACDMYKELHPTKEDDEERLKFS